MKRGERLKILRDLRGLSQMQVAELAGCSQGAITKLENDQAGGSQYLYAISKILKGDMEWIESGIGIDPRTENTSIPQGKTPLISWEIVKKWHDPYDDANITTSPSTKKIMVREQLSNIEYFSVPDKNNSAQYALRLKDDSMTSQVVGKRTFLEGEIIVVDPEKTPENGNFVIALQEGAKEALFKQYVIDGTKEYLRPLNPQYPLITLDGTVKICGVVIAHVDLLI